MHPPTDANFSALKHILRYVNGTLFHGVLYRRGDLSLIAYSDADWVGSPTIVTLLLDFAFFLRPHQSHGGLKNQAPFLSHRQKLNIMLWGRQQLKSLEFACYCVI